MRDAENSEDGRFPGTGKAAFSGLVVSFTIGLAGLIGWVFRVPLLTSFHSDFIPIAPSTALIMCAYSVLIAGFVRESPTSRYSRVRAGVAGVLTGVSILLTITSLTGVFFPVEHLGISVEGAFHAVPVGHISPVNAAFFSLTGIVILLLSLVSEIETRAFRFAVVTVGCLAIVVVVLLAAYAAGGPILYGTEIIPPALTTSVGLVGLVFGLTGVIAGRVASDRSTIQVLHNTFPYRYVGTAILGTGLFLLGTIVWFRQNTVDHRNTVRDEIVHAADMSVERVTRWRRERIADGSLFTDNDHVIRMTRDAAWPDLAAWLHRMVDSYEYTGAAILSGSGAVLLSTHSADNEALIPVPGAITDALDHGAVHILDMHVHDNDGGYALPLVVVPLVGDSETDRFGAVLVLETDPARSTFGLSSIRAGPEETEQRFLVGRDGSTLFILNAMSGPAEQRRYQHAVVTGAALPIVEAVIGDDDLAEGTDLDGTPVVATARSVPDSPWLVVVQRPAYATMQPLRRQLYVLAGFSVFVLVFLALIGLFVWRSRAARYYQSFYTAQRSLRASEDRYRITLQSIGDAVIATDATGRVEFMNAVAEDLTGWTLSAAAGRAVSDVFYVVDETHGTPMDNPVQRVLRDGKIITLTNHTELIARNDRRFPVTDTAAPIFSGSGEIQGTVLVFRDQTEERFRRKQLERSQERLRRIIDNMESGFVLHEVISDAGGTPVDYRYLDFNAAFSEVTGIDRDAIGKCVTEVFPDVREEPINWIDRIGDVGVSGMTSRFEAYSGWFGRWISVIAYSPEPGKVAAIVDDITERHAAEQELSFRSEIIEHVGDAVVVIDPDGTILYWNSAAKTLYGWSEEEALGRRQEELLPSADLKARLNEITDNLDARAFWSGEAWFKRKNGSDVLVLMTVTPTCNETGQTTAFVAIGRDITARKSLELRYAGLFQSIPDAIVITDRNREIVDCNEAFTTLFGYSLEDAAGRRADGIYDTSKDRRHLEPQPADFPETAGFGRETNFSRRDGTVFHGAITVTPLRDVDGNDLGYVDLIHDLTGRDLLQQELIAAQKMEALGLIAGGIAHDFNNVLTAISGATQMLSVLVEEESVKKYVDTVRSSVKRGVSITTRMLAFIRSSEPEMVSLGLGSFLTEFADIARHTLPKNVHIRLEGMSDS